LGKLSKPKKALYQASDHILTTIFLFSACQVFEHIPYASASLLVNAGKLTNE
jgi:hypothetical protein